MTTLAICRPRAGADMAEFARLLPAELDALRALSARGVLRDAYTPRGPGAVLLLDTDRDAAARLLADLPLSTAGLLDIELLPLTPVRL